MATGIMNGARAKVGFWDSTTSSIRFIGIYSSISYNYSLDQQGAFILGRYSAASIDTVAADLVHISASGFRVVNHGPMVEGHFPRLDQLAKAGYLSLAVMDRQSDTIVANITNVRPMSYSSGFTMRTLSTVDMTYVGILVSDESAPDNDEDATAMRLPQD